MDVLGLNLVMDKNIQGLETWSAYQMILGCYLCFGLDLMDKMAICSLRRLSLQNYGWRAGH